MQKSKSNFELLRSKPILAILDGDTEFGTIQISQTKSIRNALPYLSGPMLCEISVKFGLPATYSWGGGTKSRWEYLDNLLAHCISNNRVSDLLGFLFSKEQFAEVLRGYTPDEIDTTYQKIIATVLDQLN